MKLTQTPLNLCVIGAGAWGRASAALLGKIGHRVRIWSPTGKDLSGFVASERRAHGVSLEACNSVVEAATATTAIFLAVSSPYVREMARQLRPISPTCIVLLTKGLEPGTGRRLSEVLAEEIPEARVCVLSGGSHAEEMNLDLPCALAAASTDIKTAERVKAMFVGSQAHITATDDVLGVELCAVLKNIIAIAAGIADGLQLGDNFRGALISRGMTELSDLLLKAGGKTNTLLGPAGLGDLLATALSPHSRNRRFGLAIGRGLSMNEALREAGAVVEGLNALEACRQIEVRYGIQLSVPACLRAVLHGEAPATNIVNILC